MVGVADRYVHSIEPLAPDIGKAILIVLCRLLAALNGGSLSPEVRFAPIVLKNTFSPMIENSQSRWCASLASMRGTTSITTPADAGIDFTEPCSG